jgi:hypothetical protein
VRDCGANMDMVAVAAGEGGLTVGVSVLPSWGSLAGESEGRGTMAAVAMGAAVGLQPLLRLGLLGLYRAKGWRYSLGLKTGTPKRKIRRSFADVAPSPAGQ